MSFSWPLTYPRICPVYNPVGTGHEAGLLTQLGAAWCVLKSFLRTQFGLPLSDQKISMRLRPPVSQVISPRKKRLAIKIQVLSRLRPFHGRFGPFLFFPEQKHAIKHQNNEFGNLNFRPPEPRRAAMVSQSQPTEIKLRWPASSASAVYHFLNAHRSLPRPWPWRPKERGAGGGLKGAILM